MKGEKREIKVSDLLHQLGSDSLSFDHVFLNEFDLTEEGISGTVDSKSAYGTHSQAAAYKYCYNDLKCQ